MGSDTIIRSRENPLLKRLGSILAGHEPETLVLEGDRLIDDALGAGLVLEVVLVSEARAERAEGLARKRIDVRRVDARLLERASRLETPPGILALCPVPAGIDLAQLTLTAQTLLLVVAGVAEPGNLGALARSAEAFGAHAFLVASGSASPWNQKALRGSMGSLLRLPVATRIDADVLARELASRGVRQVAASTRGGADPGRFDWKGPIALWVSGETRALPESTLGFERVTIPMKAGVESLNVTVAASLLLQAAGRVGGPRG